MADFEVRFYRGDYSSRQRSANYDGAMCYVEQHFNSSPEPGSDYAVAVCASNASEKSVAWAREYAQAIDKEFEEVRSVGGKAGVVVGGYNGRGNANLSVTRMPSMLAEPLFTSNPKHAELIRSEIGQERLAKVLVNSIKKCFPNGGLVGFSVGHKYKASNPGDRGASLVGGGMEADYAEKVLLKAEKLLTE